MTTLNASVSESALTELGRFSLDFLHQAGQANDRTFKYKIPKLFSEFSKKIVNGETEVPLSEEFASYFVKAQEIYGKWKILPPYQIFFPSSATRSVTISYVAETKRM